jgi:cob(I)alamin adenosyltransferase
MDIKKSKVYTRTGDKGTTSLVGGSRIMKSDLRLECYGTIDELNSFLGLLICHIDDFNQKELLLFVQNKLFTLGSILATEDEETARKYGCRVNEEDILRLENMIDEYDNQLPKMKYFVLPGGTLSASYAHIARTVCRRAERRIVELASQAVVPDNLVVFVNRLSDFLFVYARLLCLKENNDEIFWNKGCQ